MASGPMDKMREMVQAQPPSGGMGGQPGGMGGQPGGIIGMVRQIQQMQGQQPGGVPNHALPPQLGLLTRNMDKMPFGRWGIR